MKIGFHTDAFNSSYWNFEKCLAWAQKMADRWQAVQHAQTGHIPFHFGSSLLKLPPDPTSAPRGAALSRILRCGTRILGRAGSAAL